MNDTAPYCNLGGVSVRESPLLPERIVKAHSPTYDFLKASAQKIIHDLESKPANSRKRRLAAARRRWNSVIQQAKKPNGKIKASDGDVEAAMKRLRRKELVPFLD